MPTGGGCHVCRADAADDRSLLRSDGCNEDFAECLTADAICVIADTGEVIEGPDAVRDYVIAVHARMADIQSRTFVVDDGFVYLEGDCAALVASSDRRINFCIAYDMRDDHIAAMRC